MFVVSLYSYFEKAIIMDAMMTKKQISRTALFARTHKWYIEVVDPELQAQCKSYRNGKKIIRS